MRNPECHRTCSIEGWPLLRDKRPWESLPVTLSCTYCKKGFMIGAQAKVIPRLTSIIRARAFGVPTQVRSLDLICQEYAVLTIQTTAVTNPRPIKILSAILVSFLRFVFLNSTIGKAAQMKSIKIENTAQTSVEL